MVCAMRPILIREIHRRELRRDSYGDATMKDKIRLGLIGCGHLAKQRHLLALKLLKDAGLDNFELTACCDVVEDNVRAAAAYAREHLGTSPAIYRDWEDLVSNADIDAVDVVLPHGLHHIV